MKHLRVSVGLVLLTGCATLKLWLSDTIDCAKEDQGAILAIIPQVAQALIQQNWVGVAIPLVEQAGNIGACALRSIADSKTVDPVYSAHAAICHTKMGLRTVNAPVVEK